MTWDSEAGTGNQWAIITGAAQDMLPLLPAESVQCIVTSPPYFGLRDYGIEPSPWPEVRYAPMPGLPELVVPAMDACLGLEPTIEAYVGHLVHIWRELRRVLRVDGCCWLNLGDSFANDGKWGGSTGGLHNEALHGDTGIGRRRTTTGLKPKDLMMIPARVALALQADGWYLRSDIIWHKKAPMPESVRDRPTRAHEHIFLLAKSARYFYDAEAIRKPLAQESIGRAERKQSLIDRTGAGTLGKQVADGVDADHGYAGLALARNGKTGYNKSGANRRDVWTLGPAPFPGAHFAVFPPRLPEPCIQAGTSAQGCCPTCGAPWERIVEVPEHYQKIREEMAGWSHPAAEMVASQSHHDIGASPKERGDGRSKGKYRGAFQGKTVDWRATCNHGGEVSPCIVLDPFCGAGTTGLVARRLGRKFIGIEQSPEYVEMASERIRGDMPMFHNIEFVQKEIA